MQDIYYFDRIRISTVISKKDLKSFLNTKELKNYAERVVIGRAYTQARINGFKGRIELYQATDKAVEILKSYDLGRYSINRIEITKDTVCNYKGVANALRKDFQNNHYLKWGKGAFTYSNTLYLGKAFGKKRDMYAICYNPPKAKFGNTNVVHTEFVVLGNGNIKQKLGINTLYDLGCAEGYYKSLAGKYLVRATLNKNRIEKHFPEKKFDKVFDFMEYYTEKKQRIRERKYQRIILCLMLGEIRRKRLGITKKLKYSKRENLIMNQGASYWLKVA